MDKQIIIKQGYYLPKSFRLLGIFLFLFGLVMFLDNYLNLENIAISTVFILIGVLCITTNNRVEIDFLNKRIHDYTWIIGFKTGKPEVYNAIEKIFINKIQTSTRATSYSGKVAVFQKETFKAFVKFDNGEKLLLQDSLKKEMLLKQIHQLAKQLNSEVQDNT